MEASVHSPREYAIHVKQIVNSFAEEVNEEFNLRCVGDGGRMPNDVEEIDIIFKAYRRATIEEARALHLAVTQKLIERINADEKIRPYLREFPFKSNRVSIAISFDRPNGLQYADGTVAYLSPARGKLFYRTTDSFTEKLVPLFEEPYAEAERLVKAHPVADLRTHKLTEQERLIDEVFAAFEDEIWNAFRIECSYIGGNMQNGIESIGLSLTLFRQTEMEKARNLSVRVTETLLQGINSKTALKPYLKHLPFTKDQIKLRIAFRNTKHLPYDEGLDSVSLEGGEITYFKGFTTQELEAMGMLPAKIPVFAKEKYEQASKIINGDSQKNSLVL